MHSKKKKILFVKHLDFKAKTVSNDYKILSEKFEVNFNNVNSTNNLFIIFALLKQFLFFVFTGFRYKLYYIWFCDYHAFIPVLFGKIYKIKTIINVGGFDATNIPEIKCGAFNEDSFKNKIRANILKYCYKNCSYIITVDDSLIKNTNTYIFSDRKENKILNDGILNYMPGLKTPIKTIYTCYESSFFKPDPQVKKENIILSVGLTPNDNEFRRKGFDLLVEAAKIMSDITFIIVGISTEQLVKLQELSLKNLKLFTKLPLNDLIVLFQKSKVFAQLSLFEGLPNTLCEAMMCECIPVGSNANGIPVAIGENGFIVNNKKINEIVDALNSALNSNTDLGRKARKHIEEFFSFDRRKQEIFKVIEVLTGK